MPECAGCRFCCWSFAVHDLPQNQKTLPLVHCPHEVSGGCAIHTHQNYPNGCAVFNCPYLMGERIHRPDTFQTLLEGLGGNLGSYIPSIPYVLPVQRVKQLIRKSRTVLATIVIKGSWVMVAMPLDREEDGGWLPTDALLEPWKKLCEEYGVNLEGRSELDEKGKVAETAVGSSDRDKAEQRGVEGGLSVGG